MTPLTAHCSLLTRPIHPRHLRRRPGDARHELRRCQHTDVRAPAQAPTLDFIDAPELQRQLDLPVGQLLDALRSMPAPLDDEAAGEAVEAEAHGEALAVAAHDAEA